MPAESWQQNFEKMRILRRELKDKYGFHVSEEMHTKHFLTDKIHIVSIIGQKKQNKI